MREAKGRARCPEETANPMSKLCFWWMLKLFWKGARKDLEMDDIYAPLKCDESEYLGDCLERSWNAELMKLKTMEYAIGKDGKKMVVASTAPNLVRAICRTFWWQYLSIGLLIGINVVVIRTFQPIFQKLIIGYFVGNGTGEGEGATGTSKENALGYAAGLVLTTLAIITTNHHTGARAMQVAMRLRIACSTLVYRKVLRLSKTSLNRTTPGQIINLLSNDVGRFDTISALLNYIWIMPCQLMVVGAVMWQSIGPVTFVGLGSIIMLIVPLQLALNKFTRYIRASIAVRSDHRIQLMSELISGIKVVKMYTWEKPFSRVVSKARRSEMKAVGSAAYLRALYLGCMMVTDKIALFSSILTYISLGNTLSADVTFPLVTYFNILQAGAAFFFPQALIQAGEAIVSIARVQTFLLLDEVESVEDVAKENVECEKMYNGDKKGKVDQLQQQQQQERLATEKPIISRNEKQESEVSSGGGASIEMRDVSANWIFGQLPPILCKISVNVAAGDLCALVGPVASGKSSLLNVLLREMPLGSGTIIVGHGSLGGGSCLTNVHGELKRGFILDDPNLRMSYASQEPWLFSGTVRENILFGQRFDAKRYEEVIRVCALKRDIRRWSHGDETVVGENGVSLSGGQKARVNLARAVYQEADLYLLDDPLSAVDARVARHLFDKCINGYLCGKTRILATHQVQYLKPANDIVVLDRGMVKNQGRFEDLKESSPEFRALLAQIRKREGGRGDKPTRLIDGEVTLEKASEREEETARDDSNDDTEDEQEAVAPRDMDKDREVSGKGSLSSHVYMQYLRACGGPIRLFFVISIMLIAQIANTSTDYWISYWTNLETARMKMRNGTEAGGSTSENEITANETFFDSFFRLDSDGHLSRRSAINIYAFLVFCCILFNMLRSFLFMHSCIIASWTLHDKMFRSILHASMRFFNANPSGRVLNRFSKDVGVMDEMLPRILLEAIRLLLMMMGVLAMIVYLNHWMIIPLVVLGTFFYLSRLYYLRTSQNIRRLEGVSKSPVFSQVKATLTGVTTIRSAGFDVVKQMRKDFDKLQDVHSGAWYLGIMASSTFGFYLDLMSCGFIGSVCFSFVLLSDTANVFSGNVGLAISQALLMTGVLQYGAKQSAEAMTHMTAVERIIQYTDLPSEGPTTSVNPPPVNWPSEGRIILKRVSLRYENSDTPVLKDVNARIEPGWKVGIVGRTGAGKTSLIGALFRLENEGLSGTITIDERDTSTLGLDELRSKISIIPQEPVLFSGTLRYNLDPFGHYTDASLWRALKEVELDELTLGQIVQEGGNNFSVGQRQLICLARAILKDNRILMLDEATANIDSRTDSLIQRTLGTRFAKYTVITVAHRLNTVIESDRILLMDSGQGVEFGCPNALLRDNPNGPFSRMVAQAGTETSESLRETAMRACRRNPNHECEKNEPRFR